MAEKKLDDMSDTEFWGWMQDTIKDAGTRPKEGLDCKSDHAIETSAKLELIADMPVLPGFKDHYKECTRCYFRKDLFIQALLKKNWEGCLDKLTERVRKDLQKEEQNER